VVVLAQDLPYPAHRGGRADVWRRILAMRQFGHQVFLIDCHEAAGPLAPRPQDLAHIDGVVQGRFSLRMQRGAGRTLRQLPMLWHTPWHAANRVPPASVRDELLRRLTDFSPDLLWLEGPWFGRLALQLATAGGWPMAYRSHNVEHLYLRRQAAAARSLRDRLAWGVASIGVQRFEWGLMQVAASVFDISLDDLSFWQKGGLRHGHWLPPLPQAAVEPSTEAVVASDLLFLGNLATPNNVNGVRFLVQQVMPLLRKVRPTLRLAIVGSNPGVALRAELVAATGVDLYLDEPDPIRHLQGARVLVNPVMTGSGVQLKTLDMLMTDAPIVTTVQGTRGLPTDLVSTMIQAEGAEGLAEAVGRALMAPLGPDQRNARAEARARFGPAAVDQALQTAMVAASQRLSRA
jgi:hypothetical protein